MSQNPRARRWAFTLNNPTPEEIESIDTLDTKILVYQTEAGEEGTTHLQGCIEFANARAFSTLHRFNERIHWEKCRNWKALLEYCQKEESRIDGPTMRRGLPDPVKDFYMIEHEQPWQRDIIALVQTEPDTRAIYWYWESTGATGKTTLARHLCLKYNAICLSGKAADMKYAVMQMERKPEIIIMDFSRSQEEFISYQGIEEIKNGMFFNTKYESGMCIFNPPHVIIFANFPPREVMLSADRWNIVDISGGEGGAV